MPQTPENTLSTPQATNWRALYAMALVGLVNLFGFGLVFPLLPQLALRYKGQGAEMGWLMALYALMGLVCSPLLGALSDRLGRKPVITWGLLGVALGHALFGLTDQFLRLAPWLSPFAVMYAARIVSGAFSAHMGVAQAYIADHTSPQDRARGMGIMGMGYGAGFVLGPAAGGLVAAKWGLFMPFWLAAAASLAAAVMAQRVITHERPGQHAQGRPAAPKFTAVLAQAWRKPAHRGAFLLFFLVPFAFSALELAIVMYGQKELGLKEAHLGALFAFAGVVVVLTQGVLLGALRRRFNELWLIRFGALLLPVGMFLIPFAKPLMQSGLFFVSPMISGWLVVTLVAILCLAVGDGLKEPSLMAYFSHGAEEGAQGGLMGLAHGVMGLSRVVGPLFAGQVFDRLGPQWPFLISGGILVGSLVAAFTLLKPLSWTVSQDEALCCNAA